MPTGRAQVGGSLTLKLALLVVGLLLVAVLSIGYLFQKQMDAALALNERADLRLFAEGAADELQRTIDQLRTDALFLARTPPLQRLRQMPPETSRAIGTATDEGRVVLELEQLFLGVAHARPAYLQLRLTGAVDGGPERVRVERSADEVHVVPEQALQRKGERYYVREALTLHDGDIFLSRIDLNREHGGISLPEQPVLRAVAPIADAGGGTAALVAIDLDMQQLFGSIRRLLPASMRMYLVNEQGFFLHHPDPAKAMTFDRSDPYHLSDEFPGRAASLIRGDRGDRSHFDFVDDSAGFLGYATSRDIELQGGRSPITLIVVRPAVASMHNEIYTAIGLLLLLAAALGVLLVNGMTRPLRALVRVSQSLTAGDYDVEVPQAKDRTDLGRLTTAFRHMVDTLREREQRLHHWNRGLEQQVAKRTAELEESRQALVTERALLQSVLDHVGDGVVAVDAEGRFTLWNERAREMLGAGPDAVPSDDWSSHFGLYRSDVGELIPAPELPLVRAVHGELVRNYEMFVRSDGRPEGCWISVFARPLRTTGGHNRGAVALLVDIEERKLLQVQNEARSRELARIGRLSLIGQIVDTAVHRLSQPLAAIANYAGAAVQLRTSDRLDDDRLDEILGHICRLAERGGEGLGSLRLLTPRDSVPESHVEVNEIVATALGLVEDRLQKKKISVDRDLGRSLPSVQAHPDQLYQALVHLLVNAIESLSTVDRRDRRLFLTTGCSDDGRLVQIGVGDNGPGVAPALRERIFEPWFTTRPDALGIGLSVVRSIAESHNSTVTLEHRDDNLTWFTIGLPVEG